MRRAEGFVNVNDAIVGTATRSTRLRARPRLRSIHLSYIQRAAYTRYTPATAYQFLVSYLFLRPVHTTLD